MASNFKTKGTDLDDVFAPRSWFTEQSNGLWSWGGAGSSLGLGDIISRSSPVQVGALTDWASISAGASSSFAIKTDGSLWAWGRGDNSGRLGLGDAINQSSPVQVGALTDWASVSAGELHSHAIKTDGSLWAWGNGANGRLGLGSVINRSSPVQVGALTDWASVSAGSLHALAIKTDGSLWAWGNGAPSGFGDTITRSSPVQVGALTDWASISAGDGHSLAIKTDGSLWAWGFGTSGRLGLGDAINQSSPVQVGALTDWASVSAGEIHSLAIKTDGSLWAWGRGDNGELGLGDIIGRSSPVQVGALTNWTFAIAPKGDQHTHAIKTDGTLWSWGGPNTDGRLGLGNTISRSSPVQVGTSTNWSSVSSTFNHSLALQTTGILEPR
jgi:alpha-tubulin suppressor-like RCC1 family protein